MRALTVSISLSALSDSSTLFIVSTAALTTSSKPMDASVTRICSWAGRVLSCAYSVSVITCCAPTTSTFTSLPDASAWETVSTSFSTMAGLGSVCSKTSSSSVSGSCTAPV